MPVCSKTPLGSNRDRGLLRAREMASPPIRRFQTAGRVRGASVRHWGSVVSVQKQRNADIQGSGIESVYIYKGTVSETKSELGSSVKVEVDILGSPSLINLRFLWTQSNT